MKIRKLNLAEVATSLHNVERCWQEIDDELDRLGIGRKDTPFDSHLRSNMMSAYRTLNSHLSEGVDLFDERYIGRLFGLNLKVLYGDNYDFLEHQKPIENQRERFYEKLPGVVKWYRKHKKKGDDPSKIAAEIYIAILGQPQLFTEGNHRTGSIIASWISLYNGKPPFILSPDNAISYFQPSYEIKHWTDKTTWRGSMQLPKYRKSFKIFWEENTDKRYMLHE